MDSRGSFEKGPYAGVVLKTARGKFRGKGRSKGKVVGLVGGIAQYVSGNNIVVDGRLVLISRSAEKGSF